MGASRVVDLALLLAWAAVGVDLARAARRARVPPARRAGAAALLIVIVVAAAALEAQTGGRVVWHPAMALAGVALAALGVALHFWARRALAQGWSPAITPATGAPLVEHGPYALVRHPLYVAILLLGAGTVLGHCSRAALAAMLGLGVGTALKRRAEDRALARLFGRQWTAYAARVPALCPRLRRGRP